MDRRAPTARVPQSIDEERLGHEQGGSEVIGLQLMRVGRDKPAVGGVAVLVSGEEVIDMAGQEVVAQLVSNREADKSFIPDVGGIHDPELVVDLQKETGDARLGGVLGLNLDAMLTSDGNRIDG